MSPSPATRTRKGNREADALRPLSLVLNPNPYAEGSCQITQGRTRVICTASLEDRVPQWRRAEGGGWITAEYGMLPRATSRRTTREATVGRQGGRTVEIQRLIGRSLRAVHDLPLLGESQARVDCDVLLADAGTRCASITGACLALEMAWRRSVRLRLLPRSPMRELVAGIGCGLVDGRVLLDLDYSEDKRAQTDANFVLTESGRLVEVQASAEGLPFAEEDFIAMLALAKSGVKTLFAEMHACLNAAEET